MGFLYGFDDASQFVRDAMRLMAQYRVSSTPQKFAAWYCFVSRTVLDVLNAEQQQLNSEVSLVGADHDEIVAQYQALSAIGQLTAQSLSLNTQYDDPEHHYKAVRDTLWEAWRRYRQNRGVAFGQEVTARGTIPSLAIV